MHLPHDLHCGTYIEAMRTVEALMPEPVTHKHRFELVDVAHLTFEGTESPRSREILKEIDTLYTYECKDMFCRQRWTWSKMDMWGGKIFSRETPD